MDDFIHAILRFHGCHTGGRAAGTIDDFIHGRQGALWMTPSMDATEAGKQKVLQIVLVQLEPAGTCKRKIQVLKIYKTPT
jgi:hypothetical protein